MIIKTPKSFIARTAGLFLFASLIQFHALAQNATSSPYSRFGVGDINTINFARNLALGGCEIGLNQPGFINYGNPAAYSTLVFTTYEAGADFRQAELKSSSSTHRTHNASFSYFDFAFPAKSQKWGLGFGLLPYSNVGYNISEKAATSFGDTENRSFKGSGGLNNFHIGSGFKITPRLSFGVNVEYLFGVINNDRIVSFESPNYFNTSYSASTSIGWFHFKGGLQYIIDSLPFAKSDSIVMFEKQIDELQDSLNVILTLNDTTSEGYAMKNELSKQIAEAKFNKKNVVDRRVKSDWHLRLGITGSPAADLRARNSILAHSFRYVTWQSPSAGTYEKDTILNVEGERGSVRIPVSAGIGFSLLKGGKWIFCGDYTYQQWSDFRFLGEPDSLVDSWRASVGIQFTPNDRSIKPYWNLINYRAGFHYEHTSLNINGKNISEMGVSLGLGLPIRKAGTMLHFTFEGGKRGTLESNLIQERYLKFTFGFTINDRWFVKPKYD